MTAKDTPDRKPPRLERDGQGRWRTGTSGNPKGRPSKGSVMEDEADIFRFGNTLVEVSAGGSVQRMRRREANLNNLFARAMKGDTRAGIYLDRRWAALDQQRAEILLKLQQLETRWYINAKPGEEVPFEVETFIRTARAILGLDHTSEAEAQARRQHFNQAMRERAEPKAKADREK